MSAQQLNSKELVDFLLRTFAVAAVVGFLLVEILNAVLSDGKLDIFYASLGGIVFLMLSGVFTIHFRRMLKSITVELTDNLGIPTILVHGVIFVSTFSAIVFSFEFFARNNEMLIAKLNLQEAGASIAGISGAAIVALIKLL